MAAQTPPGVERDPALHARLEAAYAARGSDYVPRTHLMDGERARYVNRLIEEASPYLLQHAHNPVDWHPWNDETLARAQATGRPIFLSVGYATCHWCHVMEEESFDNEEVAALLNAHFIPIKIDREQHPDLDHLYITATQLQQGHAGWPNSLWLMPDGRPFHTGTYFPKPHFMQVVAALGQSWVREDRRGEIESVAENLSEAVRRMTQLRSARSEALTGETYRKAVDYLLQTHNAMEGGFSLSQQFPQEGYLLFLMDHWRRTGDEGALTMALETLDAIAAGGIHDHVGGGFHRYTVDPNWRTPHFEKMLYNQGQLARAFVEAWEITGTEAYRRAAERTFGYVARDMTDADGAFHAAEDADSLDATGELEEGAFYVFLPEEMARLGLSGVAPILGLDQPPTIEAGAVVHLTPRADVDFSVLEAPLETMRVARDARARPLRDEKVIAGWNGLMIRALAEAAVAFGKPAYAEQAARAAETIWARLWADDDGRLARLWAGGKAREAGTLDDYAWLGLGLVALHDATGAQVWEDRAQAIAAAMEEKFADGTGRLKMASRDGPLGPIYDNADGAVPSGESSALELLARLARRSADISYEERALALRNALSGPLAQQPIARTDALIANRVIESGESGARQALARGTVRAHWLGDRIVLTIAEGWHVNAHEPGQDWLIGAAVEGAVASWPEGQVFEAGFSDQPIRVYDGALAIPVTGAAGTVSLTVQVCSHEICLEPETATFRLP